jgi:hypothetical protein
VFAQRHLAKAGISLSSGTVYEVRNHDHACSRFGQYR